MLLQLRIENLATIRELEVEFNNGFSILTGETGAGKSIVIDAILIVLGHRSDPEMIRSGEDKGVVEAIFSLPRNDSQITQFNLINFLEESGIKISEELIIRCLVSRKGRQKRNINGVSVTIDFLKKIGQQLINIHGQHDNQSLLQTASHIDFLDRFGQLFPLRKKVFETQKALQEKFKELEAYQKKLSERSIREKELKEIIDDLTELNLKSGEENDLRISEKRLTHVEKISELLNNANYQLHDMEASIIEKLEILKKLLFEAENIDDECKKIRSNIESIIFQSEDIHQELLKYISKIEDDPAKLGWINERISKIQHFTRKFHLKNSDQLINLFEESKQELYLLENSIENEKEIVERLNFLKNQLNEFAELLSNKRHQIAKKMDRNIVDELQKLGMKKALFKTEIISTPLSNNYKSCSPKGIDAVKFLLTVNPGQELRSLSKIASGGELSRIMLAIKTVLTSVDTVEILIFDEIDTGISGAIAEIVGQKLHALGKRHQTLCVTHLPQIAAFADNHFLIRKYQKNNETFTKINYLEKKNDRIRAIADLIGGKVINKQTIEFANNMFSNFQSKILEINKGK